MHDTGPAFQEWILFLLSDPNPTTCSVGPLREAPLEMNPGAALSAWKGVASLPASASFPPPPRLSAEQPRPGVGVPGPIAPNASPAGPSQGGRGTEGAWTTSDSGAAGRRQQDVRARNGGPPHPKGISGPKTEKMRKRGCAGALQGARPQPPTKRPRPRMLSPGPRGAEPPSRASSPRRPRGRLSAVPRQQF